MCLAIPGQIVDVVDEPNRLARVDVAGVRRTVNIGLLDKDADGGAGPGDWVLIHVGFALSKVDEDEARATWISTQSPGPAPPSASLSRRPMFTVRRTPATSTRASRLGSSTTSTIWPGMARHTIVPPLLGWTSPDG